MSTNETPTLNELINIEELDQKIAPSACGALLD
jgi:hypothetical protein